jgi:probable HAF family extracellular repeat protein
MLGAATSAGALADEDRSAGQTYTTTNLNLPGLSNAVGIGRRGQIVGQAASHALLWERGSALDLGVPAGYTSSAAYGVNERGMVVGSAAGGSNGTQAVVWDNGAPTVLKSLGGTQAEARAVNERGQVAGYSTLTSQSTGQPLLHAVLWDNKGAPVDLQPLPGDNNSEARGINDHGEVVGESYTTNGVRHAVAWRHGKVRALPGVPAGADSFAYSVNSRGEVAGQANGHAVVWRGGRMTDLGALLPGSVSWAHGINDRGKVIGGAISPTSFSPHAVLFDRGNVTDLGALMPDATQTDGNAINERGQVVGQWYDRGGQAHAAVWQPSR